MTKEAERIFLETHGDIITPFKKTLHENGIEVPTCPNPNATNPRKWLLRGESDKTRLLDERQRNFHPQYGQMGSYGIFFGDCLTAIMHYNPGAYYLFDRDLFDVDWLRIPSDEYTERVSSIGIQYNLRIEHSNDGLVAEETLFKHSATYQSITGIATIPNVLGLDRAGMIFLSNNFLDPEELESLPDNLKSKIIIT